MVYLQVSSNTYGNKRLVTVAVSEQFQTVRKRADVAGDALCLHFKLNYLFNKMNNLSLKVRTRRIMIL